MGWGYDLTWPIVAGDHNLRIGIIDGVPVDHSLRTRGALYAWKDELTVMSRYLSTRPHVSPPGPGRAHCCEERNAFTLPEVLQVSYPCSRGSAHDRLELGYCRAHP